MGRKFIGNVKGVGVESIKKQYYLSTSASELTGGTWEDDVPEVGDDKYLWSRWKVELTNNTSETTEAVQEGIAGADITALANLVNAIAPSGIVALEHGGTNATTAEEARNNLGLGKVAIEDIVPITEGGTGANTAAGARQNINNIGRNPITSISEDTPANWKALGTGYAYISGAEVLKNSPGTYGLVQNIVDGDTVRQIWFGVYNGDIYHRGGSATGDWTGTWKKVFDDSGVVPIKNGGTGGDTASSARTKLGLGNAATEDVVPVSKGGTGKTTASGARTALEIEKTFVTPSLWTDSNVNSSSSDASLVVLPFLKMCLLRAHIKPKQNFAAYEQYGVVTIPEAYRPSYTHALSVYCGGKMFVKARVTGSEGRVYVTSDTETNYEMFITGMWYYS